MLFVNFEEYYQNELNALSRLNYELLVTRQDDDRVKKIIVKRYSQYYWMIAPLTLQEYTDRVFENIEKGDIETCMVYTKRSKCENIAENTQIKYISENLPELNIQKLHTTAISLDQYGALNTGCNIDCKTIDFKIEGRNTYYGFLKYTENSGGAQDNQFNDAKNFVICANKNRDNIRFVLALDGEYYQKYFKKGMFSGTNKLNYLKDLVSNNKKIIIGTTDEVVSIINNLENEQEETQSRSVLY